MEIYDISDVIGSDADVLNVWREAYPDIVGKGEGITGEDVGRLIQKVAYISHFEEQVKTSEDGKQIMVTVPVAETVEEGMKFNVKPFVSPDRKAVKLHLEWGVVSIFGWTKTQTPWGELDQPAVDSAKISTSLWLADGATLLTGGMKVQRKEGERILILLVRPEIFVEQEVMDRGRVR